MNSSVLPLCMLLCASGVMLLLPHLSPRRLLFGVRVPAGFRASPPGRAALKEYALWVLGSFVAGIMLIGALAGQSIGVRVAAGLLPEFVGLAVLLRLHYRLRPYAAPVSGVREADLSDSGNRLPRWSALVLPVFLVPPAAWLYLHAHWREIPARYAKRTPLAVDAPLWFAEGMLILVALLALAMFYGSRRSANRRAILGLLCVILWAMGLLLTMVGLAPLAPISPLALAAVIPVLVSGLLVWLTHRNADPAQEVEATPDEYWTLAGIYSNPHDPAIFVQKRIGWGYTVNFGNRWSWIVLGGFMAGVLTLGALLAWAEKQ